MDKDTFLSTKDLAKLTSTSKRLWDELRCKGGGPKFIKISNRCVRYKLSDVNKWLSEKEVRTSNVGRKYS